MSLHSTPLHIPSMDQISKLDSAEYGALKHGLFSAHQMGGLPMGSNPQSSVVNSHLQHHRIQNLFVIDGSVFPSALGVNPSETIYGLAHWARDFVAGSV
jgi:choline dehydrogenase-like flavoprotein